MKLRNIYILGAVVQFVMFYFTAHYTPDTSRYFQMARSIDGGAFRPFLFPSLLAVSPLPMLATGILLQFAALQVVMRLTWRITENKIAVLGSMLVLVYQSTFIMTETLFAAFILIGVIAIKEKRWLLLLTTIALCFSLRTMSLFHCGFIQQASAFHADWFNQFIHTISQWKVLALVAIVLSSLRFWTGWIAFAFMVGFLFIPVAPSSFVRYMVPFLPLAIISLVKKND